MDMCMRDACLQRERTHASMCAYTHTLQDTSSHPTASGVAPLRAGTSQPAIPSPKPSSIPL